ncbi:PREDICTED: receptor-like protein kinase FERONIA [Ipomoea nil]|uniref:receptor-like protein kinase FERONIA n=1 Tax=Ipomoea nil TaxID=35883 RepID=UPI000900AB07|nr:PREDICTED: receptor-like protein kinase FERONIA [Ipomoea nil]
MVIPEPLPATVSLSPSNPVGKEKLYVSGTAKRRKVSHLDDMETQYDHWILYTGVHQQVNMRADTGTTTNETDDTDDDLVSGTPSARHFSLDELKSATTDFDESYVIGKGGFGKVYRASINELYCSTEDGANSFVVVKQLNKAESRQGENEF